MEKMNARTQALARPIAWGEMPGFTAQNAQKKGNVISMIEKMLKAAGRSEFLRRSVKKYGILLIDAAARLAAKMSNDTQKGGIIPSGLTDEYVYGSWSENDYVLRNTWDFGSATRTWRYQG